MRRVNSVFHIPSLVLNAWREQWNNKTGFAMNCGHSFYSVPPSNKWDMWVWVRSDAQHPGFRGRIIIPKELATER